MQTKFITLTISAVLALSAMSANALPAGNTNDNSITKPDDKAVQAHTPANKDVAGTQAPGTEAADVAGTQAADPAGLLAEVVGLVGDVVVPLVKDLLDAVVDLLNTVAGGAGQANNGDVVNQALPAVTQLLVLQPGAATNGQQPTGEPQCPPQGADAQTTVLVFVQNIVAGFGGQDAANNNPAGVLAAVQVLVGQVTTAV
ncbi:hypothetical protein BDB00DRAFT_812977 [Zychaea mexicana]|uniref:uncharacterized protein n=1 Tax=Zychaea mexicana TaxID=64656 RepID=UPI0022FE58C2|nr:uncharacterized protein BDB00DRAFT_812977 [Zychaea mexicana]KAI9495679.1 hypothetical protein BDB00DRAFT_812977 [Zychaea mexicana]